MPPYSLLKYAMTSSYLQGLPCHSPVYIFVHTFDDLFHVNDAQIVVLAFQIPYSDSGSSTPSLMPWVSCSTSVVSSMHTCRL